VRNLRQVGGFLRVHTPVSSTNKIDHHYIAEILLKVALNTITLYYFLYNTVLIFNALFIILRHDSTDGSLSYGS